MKAARSNNRCRPGATLLEVVIAAGVLAVAVPLVGGVLGRAAQTAEAARADTRSTWIIPACIEEIRASRAGCPAYLPNTKCGQEFPPDGDVWALAFTPAGKPLGRVARDHYARGTREIGGVAVGYIVSLSSSPAPADTAGQPLLPVHVSMEFPAAAPADHRRKLAFHTLLP